MCCARTPAPSSPCRSSCALRRSTSFGAPWRRSADRRENRGGPTDGWTRRRLLGTRAHRPLLARRRSCPVAPLVGRRRLVGPRAAGWSAGLGAGREGLGGRPDGGLRHLRRRGAVGSLLGRRLVASLGVARRRAGRGPGRLELRAGPGGRLRPPIRWADVASLVERHPLGGMGAAPRGPRVVPSAGARGRSRRLPSPPVAPHPLVTST